MIQKVKKKKQCKICEKKLLVFAEVLHNGITNNHTHRRRNLVSEEGLKWGKTWFCNDCWSIIIKPKREENKDENDRVENSNK